jgi:hypothetical protein
MEKLTLSLDSESKEATCSLLRLWIAGSISPTNNAES